MVGWKYESNKPNSSVPQGVSDIVHIFSFIKIHFNWIPLSLDSTKEAWFYQDQGIISIQPPPV